MAITSSFSNLATVTRASKKTDAGGWDFTNGGTVGALSEYASGVASIPAAAGMLIEEASTNECPNPRAEGASGTTLPTSWGQYAGVTASEMASGVEDGWPYLQVRFVGAATGVRTDLVCGALGSITTAPDDPFAFASGFKIVAGDMTNVSSIRLGILWRNGATNVQNTYYDCDVDSQHRRFFKTETAPAGTDNVVPLIRLQPGTGDIDITLRIYAPQPEKKAYPTSPILPTVGSPAASTRAADLTTFALGSWFSSTAWTVFFSFKPATAGVTGTVLGGIGDTFDNTVYLDIGSSGGTRATASFRSGGSSSANLTPSGQSDYAVGDTMMAAIGAEADNFAMSLNGATQATDTSGAMPVSNSRLSLGNGPWSASVNNTFCGYITDFRYFPRRLSNAELEALVGN
jgi:hypothetical protein